jgi:hypothetical protein
VEEFDLQALVLHLERADANPSVNFGLSNCLSQAMRHCAPLDLSVAAYKKVR